MKHFVVSDIHGNLEALVTLLQEWNGEDKIIFLGDLISRGEDSYPVIKLVMDLVKRGKAICLKGNHEFTFSGFLKNDPDQIYYVGNAHSGMKTVESFLKEMVEREIPIDDINTYQDVMVKINTHFKEEVEFLDKLPYYYESGDYLFVHAGVHSESKTIKENYVQDVLFACPEFYTRPHLIPKRIVFGHYPTHQLGVDNALFISEDKMKIGMDGGGCFDYKSASVHACVINTSKRAKTIINYRYYTNLDKLVRKTYKL